VETKPKPVDHSKHRGQFLHVRTEKIKRTFAAATQNAASVVHGPKANQTLKCPNHALNVCRRKEAAATDSLFADVPAVNTPGCTRAQMFVGRSSLLTDCCGFCSVSEFPNALLDNIRERGVMDTLMSDDADYEMSARVKDILRALVIGHWKSEPHCQHQNFAEHRWGHVKLNLEWLMAFLDVNPDCWLLALNCVCSVMNLTAELKRPLVGAHLKRLQPVRHLTSASYCTLCFGTLHVVPTMQASSQALRKVKRFEDDSSVLPGMSVTS